MDNKTSNDNVIPIGGGHNEIRRVSPIMKYFKYDHLPDCTAKAISQRVCQVATYMDNSLPDSAEKSTGLRKLLEAKDCLVRAAL